jgi:hypothetical protein
MVATAPHTTRVHHGAVSYLAQKLACACAHVQAHRVYKTQSSIQVLLIQPTLIMNQHNITNLPNSRNSRRNKHEHVAIKI